MPSDSALYRTVKTILEKGIDQEPLSTHATPLEGPYTGQGRFCRDIPTSDGTIFLHQDKTGEAVNSSQHRMVPNLTKRGSSDPDQFREIPNRGEDVSIRKSPRRR